MINKIAVFPNLNYRGALVAPLINASLFVFLLLFPSSVNAQHNNEPDYDEISVVVEVKGIGNVEVPALYNQDKVYLSITTSLTI